MESYSKARMGNKSQKLGIDIDNPISWNFRSTSSRIERLKRPPIVSKATWTGGPIRDSDIALIDAVNQISFIRSKIASHRMSRENDATSSISIYDVANANLLARRLLLERLGYLSLFQKE